MGDFRDLMVWISRMPRSNWLALSQSRAVNKSGVLLGGQAISIVISGVRKIAAVNTQRPTLRYLSWGRILGILEVLSCGSGVKVVSGHSWCLSTSAVMFGAL